MLFNRQLQRCAPSARRAGFTLVELMTVVAIIGVLMSLMLAAVQATREVARKMSCSNNVRNQLAALQEYHAAQQRFPPGQHWNKAKSVEYGWAFYLLPQLEQPALQAKFDQKKPWDDSANLTLADSPLKIFRCPSTPLKTAGKSDYCGVIGSFEANIEMSGLENGVMVTTTARNGNPVRLADITDGASNTVAIGESADRQFTAAGRWVSGTNRILHDDQRGGIAQGTDFFSFHNTGAHAGFADGRVQFIAEGTSEQIISALCTRSCGELISAF
jgi:prepilin-type N-terminal cleavage/methylation domain-containing protein/prepilin-type processing-associated H-X9-DG protein